MIDVLVVDDHPAIRAGLVALLRGEPGIVPVGAARGVEDALACADRSRPDVAIVDYELSDGDGLSLCYELNSRAAAPRVLIYSAFASAGLHLASRAAGAAGVLDKSASPEELFNTIRAVAAGRLAPPVMRPEQMVAAGTRLENEDRPILAMLLEGVPPDEVAAVLGLGASELDGRVRGIFARLATPTGR